MGPFKVQRQLNNVIYCLKLPSHYRISPSFQVSILKPYTDPLSPSTGSGDGDDGIPPTPDIHSAINTRSTHSFIITGIIITCTCSPSSASQACTPSSSLSGLVTHYTDSCCSHQRFPAFPYLILVFSSLQSSDPHNLPVSSFLDLHNPQPHFLHLHLRYSQLSTTCHLVIPSFTCCVLFCSRSVNKLFILHPPSVPFCVVTTT
ncbi:hypothetical protein PO909_021338 [Leuciscus waleckii]